MGKLLDVLSQLGDVSLTIGSVIQAVLVALGGFVAGKKISKPQG